MSVGTDGPFLLPEVDTPPKSGVWVDPEEWEVTDEEVEHGNRLGETIDVNDDEDAG